MARYCGIRVPSEMEGLKWDDVLFDQSRLLVTDPKRKRLAGMGKRVVPIIPEVLPRLEEHFDRAEAGEVHVFPTLRSKAGMSVLLTKRILKAGLEAWTRPWQNLRAGRDTELADRLPEHVCTAWTGHSSTVANKHYRQVTNDHFERAAKRPQKIRHRIRHSRGPFGPLRRGASRREESEKPLETGACASSGKSLDERGQYPRQESNL